MCSALRLQGMPQPCRLRSSAARAAHAATALPLPTPLGPAPTHITPLGPAHTHITPLGPAPTHITPLGPAHTHITPLGPAHTHITPLGPAHTHTSLHTTPASGLLRAVQLLSSTSTAQAVQRTAVQHASSWASAPAPASNHPSYQHAGPAVLLTPPPPPGCRATTLCTCARSTA